jgi:hypothetical protein
MKIIEGIKEKGKPFLIPDCLRDNLPEFFVEMGYKTGAEIGVYRGIFTEKFCKTGLKMYAIDPWIAYSGTGRTFKRQAVQDAFYDETVTLLSKYNNCVIIRKTSMGALELFDNNSLDFVYIDGNHDFRHIAEDLYEWEKKVRVGGVVSGHDYYHTPVYARNVICHVKPVVDAYVRQFEIKNFYLVGTVDPRGSNESDRYRSWFWIKE